MNGREYERPPQIATIYDRLRRAKIFKDAVVGSVDKSQSEKDKERIERFIYDKPTSVAISEFPVTQEQLSGLEQRVTFIRNWLFDHGQDFTHHPDVQDWSQGRTPQELEKLYYHEDDPFILTADKEQPQSESLLEGIKLWVNVDDDKDSVEIIFDFNDMFELTFGPVDDEELADNPYYSSNRPLDEMTREEFAIIVFYFDIYLQRTVGELNN